MNFNISIEWMMNGRIYENQRKTYLERFDPNPHSIRLIISWCVFQLQVMFCDHSIVTSLYFTNLRLLRNPLKATTIITTTKTDNFSRSESDYK